MRNSPPLAIGLHLGTITWALALPTQLLVICLEPPMKSAIPNRTVRPSSLNVLAKTPTSVGERLTDAKPTRTWPSVDRATSKLTALGVASLSLVALTGCQVTRSMPTVDGPAACAPFMTLDQLATALSDTEDVVLVEFCTPSGCPRCDAMRGPIDRLASDRRDRIAVRRVDLNQYPQLAWELKLSYCPCYVGFRGGQEVFRAAYPTTANLIAAELDADLHKSSADEPPIAGH